MQATRKLLQEGQAASGAASLQGHPFQPDSSSSPTEAAQRRGVQGPGPWLRHGLAWAWAASTIARAEPADGLPRLRWRKASFAVTAWVTAPDQRTVG